ncbi:uncharacterized protein Z519_08623 [Cladophialophora bantiana CBS 173.52]|uniref:Major facilitator superfamily (MFS) profile domain-containing protein n=1 Tax=Cladophialophora bantiana (strain ATCC 10958 / CBS 173.52 / CDC B-1940 / NIH 8579) TaxID=1442370 RepID=A0A0D2HJ92_CLAB1|nr:uncharacterized protein Z519_08623 [Cladophialophora bantiana CBS 173.52]KIW90840.1 hypothetical protein Z519_08623 [Cladophialophora bantiana CBS 173.52]
MASQVEISPASADGKGSPSYRHYEYGEDGTTVAIDQPQPIVQDLQPPKGYYRSPLFLGTFLAAGLGLAAGNGAFGLAAPALGLINADIGPSASISWVSIVYILTFAIGSTLVGRVTDIFGRRWFFVGGSVIAIVGTVVCARAQNVPTLIGGMTLIGLATASQASYAFVVGELVPIKYRFLAGGGVWFIGLPTNVFAGKTSVSIANNPNLGWRFIFYVLLIMNAISFLCWFFCYHPPTFQMLHHGESAKKFIVGFDYIGFLLFTAGIILLILGLSWGGSIHPWKSAHVIATLVIGGLLLIAFFIYESFWPSDEPYLPLKLVQNVHYIGIIIVMTVVAMVFYGISILWPAMITVVWPSSIDLYGWKVCAASGVVGLGGIVGGVVASFIRRLKIFVLTLMIIGTAFTGAVAVVHQDNQSLTVSLMVIGAFALGMIEGIAVTMSGIAIVDQNDIGAAVGFATSVRTLGGAIATTIYTTVLSNRLSSTIPALVPPAAIEAGLPPTSLPALLEVLQGLAPLSSVPGLTDTILAAARVAYRTASIQAYRSCFYTTIAFGGLGIVGACFVPNRSKKTDKLVAKELHHKRDEKVLEAGERIAHV